VSFSDPDGNFNFSAQEVDVLGLGETLRSGLKQFCHSNTDLCP